MPFLRPIYPIMTAHTTGSRDFTSSNTEERFSEETIFAKSAAEAGVDGSCAGAVGSGSGAAAEWNTKVSALSGS